VIIRCKYRLSPLLSLGICLCIHPVAPAQTQPSADIPFPGEGAVPLTGSEQLPLLTGVIDFETNDVSETDARAIADRLRIYLGRSGVFQVLERQQMHEILAEQGFQLSGACDTDECVVQVGRIVGARKIVAGSVSKIGKIYSLQIRVVDIETSQVEETAYADTRGSIERVLTGGTLKAAVKLARTVRENQGVPQPSDAIEEEMRYLGYLGPIPLPQGWYMRMNGGAATFDVVAGNTYEADLHGGGALLEIAVGLAISPRASVLMEFSGMTSFGVELDYGDHVVSTSSDTIANMYGGMVGLCYYLIPRRLYISALVGYSGWELIQYYGDMDNDPTTVRTSEAFARGNTGVGFQFILGWEWWFSRKVGAGVAVRGMQYQTTTSYGIQATFLWDF